MWKLENKDDSKSMLGLLVMNMSSDEHIACNLILSRKSNMYEILCLLMTDLSHVHLVGYLVSDAWFIYSMFFAIANFEQFLGKCNIMFFMLMVKRISIL